MSQQYLESIRRRSCYPTFRTFVTIATVLTYIIAAVICIGGFISRTGIGAVGGIVAAAILVLLAKVGQEVSLMVADIADATIDQASRQPRIEPQEPSFMR